MYFTRAVYGQFSSDAFETVPDSGAVNEVLVMIFTWRLESLLVLFISPFLLLPCYRNSLPGQFLNLPVNPCQWQEEGGMAAEPGDATVCLPASVSASHNHWNTCRMNMIVTDRPEGSRWYTGASGK